MTACISPRTPLRRWLEKPWFLTVWCVLAAFGSYACMYGFRKPFTAGGYTGTAYGPQLKALLVTAQVLGYMLSKFIGIKVIAEMPPAARQRCWRSSVAPNWPSRASRSRRRPSTPGGFSSMASRSVSSTASCSVSWRAGA